MRHRHRAEGVRPNPTGSSSRYDGSRRHKIIGRVIYLKKQQRVPICEAIYCMCVGDVTGCTKTNTLRRPPAFLGTHTPHALLASAALGH